MVEEPDDPHWRRGLITIDAVERWLRPMTWTQRTEAIDTIVLRLAKIPFAVGGHADGVADGASIVIGATLARFPVEDIQSYAQAVIYCFCLDEVRQQRGREWIRSSTGDAEIDVARLRDFPGLKLIALSEAAVAEREAHLGAIAPLLDAMPRQHDDLWELNTRIVWRLDNKLLHGNFAFMYRGDEKLRVQIMEAARSISDADLVRLLEERGWRSRLTAAWLIALTRRSAFVDAIGERLLASEFGFAGQGYCVALALIGGPICSKYLSDYLTKYLPLGDRYFDQMWAMAALAYLEGPLPQRFLDPALWIGTNGHRLDPVGHVQRFREIIAYATEHGMIRG